MSKLTCCAAHGVAMPLKPFELKETKLQEKNEGIDMNYLRACGSDPHFV